MTANILPAAGKETCRGRPEADIHACHLPRAAAAGWAAQPAVCQTCRPLAPWALQSLHPGPPILCSMRQPQRSPRAHKGPALLANMLLSRTSPITQTGLSFSEIAQVFPAEHSSAQASQSLTAASWYHLETGKSWTSPAGSLDKVSFVWKGDSLGQQKCGLPHARSPQNQAHSSIAMVSV